MRKGVPVRGGIRKSPQRELRAFLITMKFRLHFELNNLQLYRKYYLLKMQFFD